MSTTERTPNKGSRSVAAEPIAPRLATDNSGPRGSRDLGERFTVGPKEM